MGEVDRPDADERRRTDGSDCALCCSAQAKRSAPPESGESGGESGGGGGRCGMIGSAPNWRKKRPFRGAGIAETAMRRIVSHTMRILPKVVPQ
jgi:hypothetical protein